jgi:hypothetical protein
MGYPLKRKTETFGPDNRSPTGCPRVAAFLARYLYSPQTQDGSTDIELETPQPVDKVGPWLSNFLRGYPAQSERLHALAERVVHEDEPGSRISPPPTQRGVEHEPDHDRRRK